MSHSVSIVVATKDRPDDLRRLLGSLQAQTVKPDQVVVVDASAEPVEHVLAGFPCLRLLYLRHLPPSAAAQRNAGVRACDPSATLIGFVDDDTTFEPDAFANMLRFWNAAPPDILGAAFNIRNYPSRGRQLLKHSRLSERLGLYSSKPGSVSPSGWHTVIPEVTETRFVSWLPSTAVLWRTSVLAYSAFDEFYDSYSYLEDLDFSYSVARRGRLAVVADAGFSHFPSPHGRVSPRQFGLAEVRNRLYFVKKHKLAITRCYAGIAVRLAMTVAQAAIGANPRMLGRAVGNLQALVRWA